MGLTSLPEVGAGEALGPVKVPRPLQLGDPNRDITTAEHNAAMSALEGVCAEVGLTDGSTAGSLVARVTAIEDAPPGAGDVVGPGSSVIGRVVTWADTAGTEVSDGGTLLSDLATASDLTTHEGDTANPHSVTASQISARALAYDIDVASVNTAIDSTSLNKLVVFLLAGSDLEAQFSSSCTVGQLVTLQRSFATAPDPGGALVLGSAGAHRFNGETTLRVTRAYAVVRCVLLVIDAGVYYWSVTGDIDQSASDSPLVQAAHTTATKTLALTDAGDIVPLDATSNAIEVTIPHTLWTGLGDDRAWVCQAKVASVAGGALTFVGSGGIVIEYYGKDPGADAYIAGDWLTIVVDSATTASVFAVEAL